MHSPDHRHHDRSTTIPVAPSDAGAVSLRDLGFFVRRYKGTILAPIVIAVLIALAYSSLATPRYTAAARLLIDPQAAQGLQEDNGNREITVDTAMIESRVEAMQSYTVLAAAAQRLNLVENPEFREGGRLRSFWRRSEPPSSEEQQQRVAEALRDRIAVRRVGQSRVVEITANRPSPQGAADLANGIAEAYLAVQVGANGERNRAAAQWWEQRATQLRNQMNDAIQALQDFQNQGGGPDTRTRLQELEAAVEAYRQSYQAAFRRSISAVQQQSFPLADARVIAPAVRPLSQSWPRPLLSLALAVVLGSLVGVALAIVRNGLNRGVKTSRQVEALGLPCIGMLPLIGRRGPLAGEVLKAPLSPFADGLRRVRTELDLRSLRCIGISSVSQGAGASTIALNLAHLIGQAGKSCLVIDADLRQYDLTMRLAVPEGSAGLAAALSDGTRPEPVQFDSGVSFISAGARETIAASTELLGSRRMEQFLAELRDSFSVVIVDLPSLGILPDARAIAPHLDAIIGVAEFGRTTPESISQCARDIGLTQTPVFVVLNKVDPAGARDG